jgi:5'-3' exonuclease
MGIKNLNKFIKEYATPAIKLKSFEFLKNKSVAIDISIYLYKYASENLLIDNIYSMLLIFKEYCIQPIFVFDGKPPIEKSYLLNKRREDKHEAETEYNKLLKEGSTNTTYISALKKKMVYLTKSDILLIKKLITAFGYSYYEAPNEADEICALLCITGQVWGCISEDMDMFVYGCPNIIRYISLLNHTCVYYDLKEILNQLKISHYTLKQICILSGTDYNIDNPFTNLSIYEIYEYYYKNNNINNLITNNDEFNKIQHIFDIQNKYLNFNKFIINDSKLNYKDIKNNKTVIEILKSIGFIFPV